MATAANPAQQAHETFLQHVKDLFEKVGYYVSEGFQKIFGEAASKKFAAGALALIKTDLGQVALAAVQEAEKLVAGVDKRQAAFDAIAKSSIAEGKSLSTSLVNMLIELALQQVKGSFGTA